MAEYKMRDFYSVLDVEPAATTKEIHNAYRKLAKKWHPDVCQEPNADEVYKEIVHAYEILSDKDERDHYDHLLKTVGKGLTFDEIFSKFHFHRPGAHSPVKGENVETEVSFQVKELIQQTEKTFQLIRYVNCKDCEGHGYIRNIVHMCVMCNGVGHILEESHTPPFGVITTEKECSYCDGHGYTQVEECQSCHTKGKVTTKVNLTFELPVGATEGFRMRFPNKGDAGLNGGKNGDLFVIFRQDERDLYRIKYQYDLEIRLDVPFKTALKGGDVTIPMPDGKSFTVPVKKGLQNGNLINVNGGGLYNPKTQAHGNLVAIVNVEVPTVVSDEDADKILRLLNKEVCPQ
jgi:molecular chaperone DnaJ